MQVFPNYYENGEDEVLVVVALLVLS